MEIQLLVSGALVFLIVAYFGYAFIWKPLRPGYLRVYILGKSDDIKPRSVKTIYENGGSTVSVNQQKYNVDSDVVYRMGLFRIPTSFYVEGISAPLNLRDFKARSGITAHDFHEATESHVISEAMKFFKEQRISADMAFGMILLAVVGSAGVVYYLLNKKLDAILQAMGVQ